jgi:uncharacterized protein
LIAAATGELEWGYSDFFGPRAEIPDDVVNRGAVVNMLVSAGANVNATNDNGETALFTLEDDAVKELLKTKINLNARDKYGETALGNTVSEDIAKMLVDAGADIELSDPHGTTPLMKWAGDNEVGNVKVLIQGGAKIDRQDLDGRTALMYAINKGLDDPVEILLNAKANLSIRDNQGDTAFELARKGLQNSKEDYKIRSYQRIIKLLAAAGAVE